MKTKSLILFAVMTLALVLSACGSTSGAKDVRTLSVSGTGQANLAPDIAYIYVGVHTENPTAAAGKSADQRNRTRRLNCAAEAAVPQMEALLLVPSNVAGGAPGKVANRAGTRMSPPPPTIESTNPPNSEATVTTSISMAHIVSAPKVLSIQ